MSGGLRGPFVHPDDPLDVALQRMGEKGLDEIPVLSRTGSKHIGALSTQQALNAYKQLADSPRNGPVVRVKNWLPVIAAIMVSSVLIVSGLVFWQRARQSDRGEEAFLAGQALLAQGQVDGAVSSYRNALAHAPDDVQSRTAM
jgi:hypothetical protein